MNDVSYDPDWFYVDEYGNLYPTVECENYECKCNLNGNCLACCDSDCELL